VDSRTTSHSRKSNFCFRLSLEHNIALALQVIPHNDVLQVRAAKGYALPIVPLSQVVLLFNVQLFLQALFGKPDRVPGALPGTLQISGRVANSYHRQITGQVVKYVLCRD